ncbi:MAG: putative metal-binding protein [Idiomarina sp. T82-3]|jgi:uncharacterized GH25 family protein|uniref:DUF4198 domain-containing protein n=1 Tax=Idiomarina TaxID=135575 RepID=UPI000793A477|nr:DUF4198 domain-containing protein [Idiomarina sp. T82-3]KXS36261.1 MAG: putative metal-binding protein [Idiomarina sp. T82-3]
MIKRKTSQLLLMGVLLTSSLSVNAHRLWIKPNTTTVSGQDEWVTFDAAIANGIFNPDHFAMPLDRLTAYNPDGQPIALQNQAKLKYRSVFDLQLTQPGTYEVSMNSRSLQASWQDDQGKRQRWPSRGEAGTLEGFRQHVPQDAKDLKVFDSARRVEVFVTAGAPSQEVITPTGNGLELNGKTHPNDLYTGESVSLGFLFDGEPAQDAQVTLVRQGEKYRDNSEPMRFTTNAEGVFEVSFDAPGMYFIEVEYKDDRAKAPAMVRLGNYSAVIEVLPL